MEEIDRIFSVNEEIYRNEIQRFVKSGSETMKMRVFCKHLCEIYGSNFCVDEKSRIPGDEEMSSPMNKCRPNCVKISRSGAQKELSSREKTNLSEIVQQFFRSDETKREFDQWWIQEFLSDMIKISNARIIEA